MKFGKIHIMREAFIGCLCVPLLMLIYGIVFFDEWYNPLSTHFRINKIERKVNHINNAIGKNDYTEAHKTLTDLSVFCKKIENNKRFNKRQEMATLYNNSVEIVFRSEITYVLTMDCNEEFAKKKVIALLLELETTPILYGERDIILSDVYDYVYSFAETIDNKEIAKYVTAKKKELTRKND